MKMEWDNITMTFMIVVGILLFTGIIAYSSYEHRSLKYENFQSTIQDLNDDQKCLHICGFQYPATTYFDNYKYCVEKCDRISERTAEGRV